MGRRWSRIWRGWQRFARRLAEFQGRFFLGVFYTLLVCPVGAMLQALRDPLGRRRPTDSNWAVRDSPVTTLDEARRQ